MYALHRRDTPIATRLKIIRQTLPCLAFIIAAGRTLLQLSGGQQLSCDVFVGADGANSVAAKHLGLPQANYAGYVGYR